MSATSEQPRVDFADPVTREQAIRIGSAWLELRRGPGAAAFRDYLYGRDGTLVQGQIDALDYLARRDRKMSGLADKLRIDPSTATRAVQRLVDDGLAERVPSHEDGRVVMVRLTCRGHDVQRAVAARRSHVMARILAAFDATERAQLADLLDRFVESVDDVVAELD
jgi:DNA-binding MarR family transcriptional regulator